MARGPSSRSVKTAAACAARPKSALPKASGKSAVRHLLQQYCDEASAHQGAFRCSDGIEPSEFVFVDGSVLLMHAAASLGAMGFRAVSPREVFRKTFHEVGAYASHPETRAVVVAMDKPSLVPPRKSMEQATRDAVFAKTFAKDVQAAESLSKDAFNEGLLRCGDVEEAFERCFCFMDADGELVNVLEPSKSWAIDLDESRVSAFMWKHFIQNRRCRGLIVDFLMSTDSFWSETAPRDGGASVFRDWETPQGKVPDRVKTERTANSYGEADASWVYWAKVLCERFPRRASLLGAGGGPRRLSVVTVDTDVMMLGLMWQKFNSDSAGFSLQICLKRAGDPVAKVTDPDARDAPTRKGNLWIDVPTLSACVDSTYKNGGVEWFVRSSVLAGASDFTHSDTYPGISISHMADVARSVGPERPLSASRDSATHPAVSEFVTECYKRRYTKTWARYFNAVDVERHKINSMATDWVWTYWLTSVDGGMDPQRE